MRKLVCQALKDSKNGLTVEETTDKVRGLGWIFCGVGSFAVLQILAELSEEKLARQENGKYRFIPGREAAAKVQHRQQAKPSGDLRTLVLGRRFFPDDERRRTQFVEVLRDIIAQVRKESQRVVVFDTVGEGYRATVNNSKMQATGQTITEAIGMLMVLHGEKLGFDFQAKEEE